MRPLTPEELMDLLQRALEEGLATQIYQAASVSDVDVLEDCRLKGHVVLKLEDLHAIPTDKLDEVAADYLKHYKNLGAVAGLAWGTGGILTAAPEMVQLLITVVRMAQRLSLTYGLEFESFKGNLELWEAIGDAFGVKVEMEGVEQDILRNLPAPLLRGGLRDPLVLKIASGVLSAGAWMFVKRWLRFIPLFSLGVSTYGNYRLIKRLGLSLQRNFRRRHELLYAVAAPPPTDIHFYRVRE